MLVDIEKQSFCLLYLKSLLDFLKISTESVLKIVFDQAVFGIVD